MWLLFLVTAMGLGAHEIGTTRVEAEFGGRGKYVIEIETDAAPLREKIGDMAAFDATFRRRVALAFDGAEARPEIALTEKDGGATVRLTGEVPAGAKSFTWKFGWVFTTYSLQVKGGETVWLEGGAVSRPIGIATGTGSRWMVARQYLALGFTHILPYGLDHVLFVLGLYLLSSTRRSVLTQVTAFTVAHSITLGLSMYGWLRAPAAVVEPLIAVSIAYVAIENLFLREVRAWRVALVFCFGLLHGMGFAGVLTELGLPQGEFVAALLAFNGGVELGQLAVIGAAFLAVGWPWSERAWYRARVVMPASVAIACVAVYWTVERVLS